MSRGAGNQRLLPFAVLTRALPIPCLFPAGGAPRCAHHALLSWRVAAEPSTALDTPVRLKEQLAHGSPGPTAAPDHGQRLPCAPRLPAEVGRLLSTFPTLSSAYFRFFSPLLNLSSEVLLHASSALLRGGARLVSTPFSTQALPLCPSAHQKLLFFHSTRAFIPAQSDLRICLQLCESRACGWRGR